MANGGTLTELVSGDSRGKWAILAALLVASQGFGWWITKEGQAELEKVRAEMRVELATQRGYIDARIASALQSNQLLADAHERESNRRFEGLERAIEWLRDSQQ